MKKYTLTFFCLCILSFGYCQDTIFVRKEPIHIAKQVYYAKPKDTTYLHHTLGANVVFGQRLMGEINPIDNEKVKFDTKNTLAFNLEISQLTKKLAFGTGLGFRSLHTTFSQEIMSKQKIDSSLVLSFFNRTIFDSILVDTITFDSSKVYKDTSYTITDTVETYKYDTLAAQKSQIKSNIIKYYICIPLSIAFHKEINKFGFELRQTIFTYLGVGHRGTLSIQKENEQKQVIKNTILFSNTFFVLATDFRISYKILQHARGFLAYQPRFNINSPYKNAQTQKFTQSASLGAFILF